MNDEINIEKIRTSFKQMQTKDDLLNLLNEVKPFLYGNNTVPFELHQLSWCANPNLNGNRYVEFDIKKKSGAIRSIHAPVKGLKAIQKSLALVLQCVFEPHEAAMGFAKGKSVVDNAAIHVGNNYVYNIDLKDFFPSIDQARVWKCLQLTPFSLTDKVLESGKNFVAKINSGIRKFHTEFGESISYRILQGSMTLVTDRFGNFNRYKQRISKSIPFPDVNPDSQDLNDIAKLKEYDIQLYKLIYDDAEKHILLPENIKQIRNLVPSRLNLANIIASICCNEMEVERMNLTGDWEVVRRNVLPQGAPTSPILTNVICQKLDRRLSGVANRFGLKYSRYADDITFSSMHNVYHVDGQFSRELYRVIEEQGFHIKESKTRLQKNGYRKEVTGLLVNEKANVQQRYIKQLRMWLNYWERYGFEKSYELFTLHYKRDKGDVKKNKPDFARIIDGKLNYLRMVKGNENELYINMKRRFDILTNTADKTPKRDVHLNKVIEMAISDGIEKAMDIYKPAN